jgi:predicted HicB family RNase H-like nuclease
MKPKSLAKMKAGQEEVPYTLRLPRELHDRVREEAKQTRRSINGMYVRALEERYGRVPESEVAAA